MQDREGQRYLDPTALAKIGISNSLRNLSSKDSSQVSTKAPITVSASSSHSTRQYMPGDDIKHLDWKAYGRTNRYYIKQFEEETNLNCYLLLDTSESMTYGSGELTKLQYASYLIASIAYFMAKQRDAVGFAYFDERLHEYLPARSSPAHLHAILLTLERIQTNKLTQMGQPIHQIAERLTKRDWFS